MKSERRDYYNSLHRSRRYQPRDQPTPMEQYLENYLPNFVDGAYMMRRAFYPHPTKDKEAAIPRKYRELIMIALEIGTGRGGSRNPGVIHTRGAVREAGATPREIAETVAIATYLCGMPTQVDHGVACIKAAEEEYEKLKKSKEP